MNLEENKALYRRLIEEVWNQGRLATADELLAPDATAPSAPELPAGAEGVKAVVRLFRTAFPDFHITIEDILAEGDKVAARLIEEGTHQGTLTGIPPTGRRVTFSEIAIVRIVDGRIVESRWEADMLGLYEQLGVIRRPRG